MLSKTAATQSGAELQSTATGYFNALFARADVNNIAITADYTSTNGSKVTVSGSATINTNFLGVLGYSQLNITASTTSAWGNTRLRVALVLDNTGSMSSSNKMSALKTASQGLLTQHGLYRAGQHRQRSHVDAAEELRERCEQILPADVVNADGHDVQSDWHRLI